MRLSADARRTIKEHGVTIAAYVHHYSGTATWGGDICGCTDDRCANGYHHAGEDDCRCLPVLLDMMPGTQHAERPGT